MSESSPKEPTAADTYSVLMDVRVWVFDHMDVTGMVDANALDDYLATFTDAMDGTNGRHV